MELVYEEHERDELSKKQLEKEKSRKEKKSKKSKKKKRKHRHSDSDSSDDEKSRKKKKKKEKERKRKRSHSVTSEDEREKKKDKERKKRRSDSVTSDEEKDKDTERKRKSSRSTVSEDEKEKFTDTMRAEVEQKKKEEEAEMIGPAIPQELLGRNEGPTEEQIKANYGKDMLRGEAQAVAAYIAQGKCIPRRGEIGSSSNEISEFEKVGYVMSGTRHKSMEATRRKENQVLTAEEKRHPSGFTHEERMKKEDIVLQQFRDLISSKKK